MTQKQRKQPQETATMRFLLNEFIQISDDGAADAPGIEALKERTVRTLLPGPRKGALWPAQLEFKGLASGAFQQLRRDARNWLGAVARSMPGGHPRTLNRPLTLSLVAAADNPGRFRAPIVEGDPLDVFWFYLVHLLARVGPGQIRLCRAPRAGTNEPCGNLFLRRGDAKRYCSPLCRVRLAARKSRKK